MNPSKAHEPTWHPIGVVSTRTGIPKDLIRAWERRYAAVTPERGPTGRRVYSSEDIARLSLLKRVVGGGWRISEVANMSLEDLTGLVAQEMAEPTPPAPVPARAGDKDLPAALLAECLQALENLDKGGLEKFLSEAAIALSGPRLRNELIVPLLHTIGERWQEGSLRMVHEHMSSALVRSFIESTQGRHAPEAPLILVTTPAGQHHELGALMAAAVAHEAGWNVLYLGPNLPAEEIAAGVRQVGARAVGLSVVFQDNNLAVQREIRKLAEFLGPAVPIFVGGRAIGRLSELLTTEGLVFPRDMKEFQDRLGALQT